MPAHRVPSEIKDRQGTRNPSQDRARGRGNEPKVVLARPDPPEDITEAGLHYWERFSDLVYGLGVLTEEDRYALAEMCEVYAELMTLRAALAEKGRSYEDDNGNWKEMPEVRQRDHAEQRFLVLLTRFGLTPADRSRVNVIADAGDGDVKDPWSQLGPTPLHAVK